MQEHRRHQTFTDSYPFYLSEHRNVVSRRLHVVGTTIAFALLVATLITGNPWRALVALVQGYASAWVDHFYFEHNRSATFQYPLFSLAGDWRLWCETLSGKSKTIV